ncbi:MAG: SDR family NAD(P)-dependent oxidoreductase, partial [Gemmatimonadetes bacterium]|nr:SDR family NAD(P)-dependent oxidoreductase [Gemmatimonadota bacterium]
MTGGSRGIGAATARLLAQAGASVALTYKSREKDAQEVLESLEKGFGTSHVSIQADLGRADDCERAVDAATKAFGRLDILIANAGIWPPAAVPL